MSRLRKLKKSENQKKGLIKSSSYLMELNSKILKSGDVIGISVRVVNWKPWYQVYLEYDAGQSSSFYDGPDSETAYRFYMDVLTAFKGVSESEKFAKEIPTHVKQIEMMIGESTQRQYHNQILKAPKFLGINDF